MVKNLENNRKAFTIMEMIIVIAVLSIITTMIYQIYMFMEESKISSAKAYHVNEVREKMINRLSDNKILEAILLDSNETKYYDSTTHTFSSGFPKNKFSRLLNTPEKINFWGISSSKYKKYLYPQEKSYMTVYGEIPYVDFYVIILPPELDKYYSANVDDLEELFEGNQETGKILNVYWDQSIPYASKYPKLSLSISEKTFKKTRKDIIVYKISTQKNVDLLLQSSIDKLESMAKNLKDWASIQMAMYENIVAKYGGSFDIDYFISMGQDDQNSQYEYKKIYSSVLLESNPTTPLRQVNASDPDKEGFLDIHNFSSTLYGMVICQNNNCNTSDDIVDLVNFRPDTSSLNVENAIAIESKKLMDGSKNILGVETGNYPINNSFGTNYKYYFSNHNTFTIKNLNGTDLVITQNVPTTSDSYAPYSSTLFTIFPWFYDPNKTNDYHGYVGIKVFPELR